jgi:hypothetical protein
MRRHSAFGANPKVAQAEAVAGFMTRRPLISQCPEQGQSPGDTVIDAIGDRRGSIPVRSMAAMTSISLIALAAALAAAAERDAPPRAAAVVAARATVMSGVRITLDRPRVPPGSSEASRLPPARERACPEKAHLPCRMIVTDLP